MNEEPNTREHKPIENPSVLQETYTLFNELGDEQYEARVELYDCYTRAMRLRGREPLDWESFYWHFFSQNAEKRKLQSFGNDRDGYLLGGEIDQVFVPSHFAPSGIRGGYRLIKELMRSDIPTALFITQDLVDTIRKMKGWKVLPFRFTHKFRGEPVEKILVINKWSALPKLAKYQASELIRKEKEGKGLIRMSVNKVKEFGKRAQELAIGEGSNMDIMHESSFHRVYDPAREEEE
jgi:hypothetical protein